MKFYFFFEPVQEMLHHRRWLQKSFASSLVLFLSTVVFAGNKILQTNKHDVIIYSQPQTQSKAIGKLPKGKIVEVLGEQKSGFWRVRSKTGRELWVQDADVSAIESVTEEILEPPTPGSPAAEAAKEN
ncbi:MAG: SH3 domain-containing protein, partial [Bdellovibrionales bacterium]|nr:SH3 domain-containing protein [Bdellovibrionales bacterium]